MTTYFKCYNPMASKAIVWYDTPSLTGLDRKMPEVTTRTVIETQNGCLPSVSLKIKPLECSCTWICQWGVVPWVFLMPERRVITWVMTWETNVMKGEFFSFPCHPLVYFCEDAQLLEQKLQTLLLPNYQEGQHTFQSNTHIPVKCSKVTL